MKRIVGIILVFLLAALIPAQIVLAAGAAVSTITLNQVRQNGADLTAYVNLLDENGNPVTGEFDPAQFVISVDNNALPVDSVQGLDPATQGIHYVFTMDVSGSLNVDMMNAVRSSLNAFVEQMGPLDTASIITFGEKVQVRLSNSGDKEQILQTLANVVPDEQYTMLYEGVVRAVNLAKGGRSAVVVITDGKNTQPDGAVVSTKEDIFAQLEKTQVPLYCIGLNDDQANGGSDVASLTELADATGGEEYDGMAADIVASSMQRVSAITHSAIELHATLVNPDGRTDFGTASTIMAGYQGEGGVIASNTLQQIINWVSVPGPAAEVTPTPVPKISLELDTNSETVPYVPGAKTTLTGLIEVEQGSFSPDDLTIIVNDEAWRTTLMHNGSDYTFSAEGVIGSNVSTLNVRAVIRSDEGDISSRLETVSVLVPTATPGPKIEVVLDDLGRDILFESGKTVSISGTINVSGNVDPNEMELFVNGVQNEITVNALQANQYEFTADVVLPEQVVSELKVQIVLKDANARSHVQMIPLVAPTAEPDPELRLTLSDESVVYTSGQPLTLRGNIEIVSGQVAPEDLALYVNSGPWNMELTAQGDGTYSFEAVPEYELVGNLTKLEVRVRLASRKNVSSEMVTIPVTTPEPEATATPSPRPAVTPPPTGVPTKAPVSEQTEPESAAGINSLYYYIIGGVVLLILIVLAVVFAMKKKKQPEQEVMPTGFTTVHNGSENSQGTVRDDVEPDGIGTIVDGTVQSGGSGAGADFVDDDGDRSHVVQSSHVQQGTVSLDSALDGTMRLDSMEQESGGTVRLEDDDEQGGTVRLEERWELAVTVNVSSRSGSDQKTLHLTDDGQQVVFGRSDAADVVIDDSAVSSRHLAASFDGEGMYITDLGSTNGTKVNNVAIAAHEPCRLASGDHVRIGKTTLEFTFGEPELW